MAVVGVVVGVTVSVQPLSAPGSLTSYALSQGMLAAQQQPSASLHSSQSEPSDLLAMSQRLLASSTAASSQRLMGSRSFGVQQSFQPTSPGNPAVSPFEASLHTGMCTHAVTSLNSPCGSIHELGVHAS